MATSQRTKMPSSFPGLSMAMKRSSTVRNVVFTNRELLPSLGDLPDEDYPHSHYYRPTFFDSKVVPIWAWFFLGEITVARSAASAWHRHRVLVTDIDGQQGINIDSYTDGPPFDYSLIKNGHTLCIRFGARHRFLDGTVGIRVEEFKKVYVFPVSLATLMTTVSEEIKANMAIHRRDKPCDAEILAYVFNGKGREIPYEPPPPPHCWQCKTSENEETKMKRCARCKLAGYCGKECQTEHWKVSHKYSCKGLITYTTMVENTKTALNNLAQHLDAFVSTDEDENDEEAPAVATENSSSSED